MPQDQKVVALAQALMGRLGMAPPPDRVTVTAKRPPKTAPYPENVDEIFLGTATTPPSGYALPPLVEGPRAIAPELARDPVVMAHIAEADRRWPFVSRYIRRITTIPDDADAVGWLDDQNARADDPTNLHLGLHPGFARTSPIVMGTMGHELSHAADALRYPDPEQRDIEYVGPSTDPATNAFFGRPTPARWDEVAWARRPGEIRANAVRTALKRKYKDIAYDQTGFPVKQLSEVNLLGGPQGPR